MVTIPSSLNGILNIQNAIDNSTSFGIREHLDLNPGTFHETVVKLISLNLSFFIYRKWIIISISCKN